MPIYVDIPDYPSPTWKTIDIFSTRSEAIEFCKKQFNADDEGRVSLISGEENHVGEEDHDDSI